MVEILDADLPTVLFEKPREECMAIGRVALLGKMQGGNPGHRILTLWARDNLHRSFQKLIMKGRRVF